MNLNDFFSKPSRIKEAYTNNYPSSAAPAASASLSGKAIDDPDVMGSLKSTGTPKFDRFSKTDSDPGILGGETEAEPRLMAEPNKYMQSWGGKFATGSAGEDNRFTAPVGWRYVEKGEDPARYGSATAAATSALPDLKYDPQSRTLKSADALALDMSPKSKFKFDRTTQSQVSADGSGANPNIDNATRDRARAWAAKQNAPAAPSAALKDIPVEKPSSWKDIAQANNIANPNRIMPGQKLKIPGRADYVVQPGDTLGKIAAGQPKAPKITPSFGDDQPAAVAKLKSNPNLGTYAPLPRNVLNNLGIGPETTRDAGKLVPLRRGEKEELLTPAIIKKQAYNPTPAEAMARLRATEKEMAARAAAANRKKTNEDDIDDGTFDDQTQVSSIERDSTSDIDGKTNRNFSSTSFQQDPADPGNNSYMDRQENNGVASTTFARNVTPKWMSNLKATAGLPGAKPAAQPPSQYPTQVGQGENNRPFAAYSTPPGQLEINRESIDRMRSLAGIHKK